METRLLNQAPEAQLFSQVDSGQESLADQNEALAADLLSRHAHCDIVLTEIMDMVSIQDAKRAAPLRAVVEF